MANPATWADVEKRWRPLSAAERVLVDARLADAWAIVKQRVPDIEARMAAYDPVPDPPEGLDPAVVVFVLCAMVLRVSQNPEGKRQESIDDYSYMRDNTTAAGQLYLSDDEYGMLIDSPTASEDAFTITPYGKPGYATVPDLDWS